MNAQDIEELLVSQSPDQVQDDQDDHPVDLREHERGANGLIDLSDEQREELKRREHKMLVNELRDNLERIVENIEMAEARQAAMSKPSTSTDDHHTSDR